MAELDGGVLCCVQADDAVRAWRVSENPEAGKGVQEWPFPFWL